MHILSWNILSGGFKDYSISEKRPERIDAIAKVIHKLNPDFISLIDTFRWTEIFTQEDIRSLFGFPYIYMVKLEDQRLIEKGHDNGITVLSKIPNTQTESIRIGTRNAIKSHVNGIDIFSVYLDDLSEDTRVHQTHTLMSMISNETPTLITGDFNTFSKQDIDSVSTSLSQLNTTYPKVMTSMNTVFDEMKRAETIQILENNGFIDFGFNKGNTVPAKLFPLPIPNPIMRLDYVFGNNKIVENNFKVITDDVIGNLSDHYPIACDISVI